MIRPFTFLCFLAFAGAGAWLYQVKHQVASYDRELRDIRRQIEQARDRTTILRAEWALLNEPDRLRQVATRHLPLEPMQPQQFARLPEMERRLPHAVAFAGAPNLFAPPEPVRGTAPVMLAAAQVPAPVTRAAPAPAPVAAPAPSRPAADPRAQDPRAPESPAVQALAAAVAAQRASQTRPAPTMPPRPAPLRDVGPRPASPTLAQAAPPAPVRQALAPIQQAAAETPVRRASVPAPAPATAPAPAAPVAPSFVSALGGGSSLGRPMLAPPVPISSAVAGTLDGRRGLPAPQPR